MKNYDHVIKNKVLPSGKLISDYQIMTGKDLSEAEFNYIDEIGILPVAPKRSMDYPKRIYYSSRWLYQKGNIICLRKI